MKLKNRLPFILFHTNDWLTITRGLSMVTKGFLIELICLTWSRECEWITLNEAKEIALRGGVTIKQFVKITRQLAEYINNNNEFEIKILKEMMNDAIDISEKRSQAALKRWGKTEETDMH